MNVQHGIDPATTNQCTNAVVRNKMNFWDTLHDSRRFWLWFLAPAIGALAGFVYGQILHLGLTASVIRGAFIGAPILLYERGNIFPRWREKLRTTATPIFVLATIGTHILFILVGNAAAGTVLHHLFGYMRTAREAMALSNSGVVYALIASALVTFVFRIRDLIGPSLFTSLLLGRYHRPTKEERIFLFLDITDSTQFADLNGDLETQAYLNEIFCALALPVRRSRGSIDDYVGDMAIITWPKQRGIRDGACIRCVYDFAAELEKQAVEWTVRFGQVPQFRAVLHCGWVVTAEIGMERHKIAYFGDVMNTTGRLEALAKNFNEQVLISAELFNTLENLPGNLASKNLGRHKIRGRSEPLEVFAIRPNRA